MKMTTRTMVALVALITAGGNAVGATILVDYDDGDGSNGVHDASIRNGGFEDVLVTAGVAGDRLNYAETPFWENVADADQTAADFTRTNLEFMSDQNGVSGDAEIDGDGLSQPRNAVVDTGYIASAGDVVNFEYYWRDAFQWVDTADQMSFIAFTTDDDTSTGAVATSQSLLSGLSTANSSYQLHAGSITLTAGAGGKKLFIAIDGVDGGGDADGFTRIDNVFVEVVPVPEPGSLLLLGALLSVFGLSGAMRFRLG